jgi:hypothetical protein
VSNFCGEKPSGNTAAGGAIISADFAPYIRQAFLASIGICGTFGFDVFYSSFDASDLHCGFDQLVDADAGVYLPPSMAEMAAARIRDGQGGRSA